MDLISTHVAADFDCLSSLIAARRLYPDPLLTLPGSVEGPVRRYLERPLVPIDLVPQRQIDRARVSRFVLVDVSSLERVGPLREWILESPHLPVDYYDHHPGTDLGLPHARGIVRAVGATTTLMVGLLRERGLALEAPEATTLALGIYEDTGFLTFATTTPEDLEAVAWLRRQGADLRAAADYLRQGLGSEQIRLYHDLLEARRVVRVRGQEVTLSAVQAQRYVQDAAGAVHHLVDQEGLRAFVALVAMEDQVVVIGRSRGGWVDMAALAARLGGGGHPPAASATVRGRPLPEVEAEVVRALEELVPAETVAADLMIPAPPPLPAGRSVRAALAALNRGHSDFTPVSDRGRVVGLLSRRTLDHALRHGLERAPVRDVLLAGFETLPRQAPIAELHRLLVGQELPAVGISDSSGALVGLVTRTRLFERLAESSPALGHPAGHARERGEEDLSALMARLLPAPLLDLLRGAGAEARSQGGAAYLVGGGVRDLLLEAPSSDLDLVIEGDAVALARRLRLRRGGRVHAHARFGTAAWILPGGHRLDFAGARREFYERPAALPEVEPGTLAQDLFRRDFTFNALAVRLDPSSFGRLVDPYGGQRDLRKGWVRVLHGLSFVEDPTRALRAIRFATRFRFTISGETEALIRASARRGLLETVSGARLWKELRLILEGERVVEALAALQRLGLLAPVLVRPRLERAQRARLEAVQEVLHWHRLRYDPVQADAALVGLMAVSEDLGTAERRALGRRLDLPPRLSRRLEEAPRQALELVRRLEPPRAPADSAVYLACRGLPIETLLYAMALAAAGPARPLLSRHLTSLIQVRREIGGEDLKRLGLAPGPAYARILEQVLLAKIDGRARTRREEMALARRLARAARQA
jgi:tRNA nucleotidyltransferase (CCA-adding enzyme)